MDWTRELVEQLDFYWQAHLRPRLEGLTDEEYYWEPVEGCWSVRPDATGRHAVDFAWPVPDPPPVTTIAWRMTHIALGCFDARTSTFFRDTYGDLDMGAVGIEMAEKLDMPATAKDAIDYLERSYRDWHDAIAALDYDALIAPLGPKGGPYADSPMAALVLHINREAMHHGGEIGVLRDLYRAGLGSASG